MIVRRTISADLLQQLDQFSPALTERIMATKDDPAYANVHDYLGACSSLPHESILRWIDYRLPGPTASVEDTSGYIRQQLSSLDAKDLPADLAWALVRCLDDEGTPVCDALRVVHACTSENIELARQLQVLIDKMDAHLVRIGCAKRTVPMIVGMPRTLDQKMRHGRMSTTRGMCTWSGVHALVMLDIVLSGLAVETGPARAELEHTLVHEMIHGSQSLKPVGAAHMGLVEGLTEMAVQQLGKRTNLGVYDTELALAHAVRSALREDISFGAHSAHDLLGLFDREASVITEQELRYALDPRARFVTHDIAYRIKLMACDLREMITWQVEPSEDIEQLARDLAAVHSSTADASREPRLRAAALIVWASHVMQEEPVRAFSWLGARASVRHKEIDAIARWRKDETAISWIGDLEARTYDYSFWAQAAYLAADIDHDLLLAQWPAVRDRLASTAISAAA